MTCTLITVKYNSNSITMSSTFTASNMKENMVSKLKKSLTCGFTTYCPLVADLMSNECSNSRVNDSIVLAGLGRGDDCEYTSSGGGG
jgi:hypothetical protein